MNAANTSPKDSAIHFAVWFDRYDILPLLLEHGTEYTAINLHGQNIAHGAAQSASLNLVRLDFNLRDKHGKTPADYLIESHILVQDEEGLHDALNNFLSSTNVQSGDTSPSAIATNATSLEPQT